MGMFGLPYINKYIGKVVKEQQVADTVDYLNYYVTAILLATASFFISAKQYFGSPIQCWLPKEFTKSWETYSENYCFINNLYRVPMEEEIPSDLDLREDHLSYYRWVPIVLALQSLGFWLPNYLWNMLHKQTAVNPRAVVREIKRCKKLHGKDREKEVSVLASYIADVLDVFNPKFKSRTARNGWNATILYIFIKFLYLANIVGQLLIMDKFLGGEYLNWGIRAIMEILQGHEWKESEVFPRVIVCDFTVRILANQQRYSSQCVIMLNMLNEKLYLFLYLWFSCLAVITLISCVNQLVVLCFPWFRTKFIANNIDSHNNFDVSPADVRCFVHDYLHADGVLLLHFVRQHVGGRATYDLINALLKTFKGKYTDDSVESSPRTVHVYSNKNYKKNLSLTEPDSATYKPTGYGPDSLYPAYPREPNESSELDYIDNAATLPVSDSRLRTPLRPVVSSASPRNGRTPTAPENHYSQLPPKTSV